MKRLVCIILLTLTTFFCFGQNTGGLKFLGIPVDGSRAQFKKELKNKGFSYNSSKKSFKGQFNGEEVTVYLHTNHSLVDRVLVAFPLVNENRIRINYNNLLAQFDKNTKYLCLDPFLNNPIPDSENISYEIAYNKKEYIAAFYYFSGDIDPIEGIDILSQEWQGLFSDETLKRMKDFASRYDEMTDDERESFLKGVFDIESFIQENNPSPKNPLLSMLTFFNGLKAIADGRVWFTIHKFFDRYQIALYYDNLHNQAHGEDL